MNFEYDDGGRAAAGYRGTTGDCVARAIAIAARMPYEEVYQRLASGNASQRRTKNSNPRTAGIHTASHGIDTTRKWFKDFMEFIGFEWVPTMRVGSGCKVHLREGELPMGRLVVAVSRHYTAVIDGAIRDTYSPERSAGRCVYGYWKVKEER